MVKNTTTTTTTTTSSSSSTSGSRGGFALFSFRGRKKNIHRRMRRRRRRRQRRPLLAPRALPSHNIVVIAILVFCCLQFGSLLITHRNSSSSSTSSSIKIKHRSSNNNNNNNTDSNTEKEKTMNQTQTQIIQIQTTNTKRKPYFIFHVGIGKTATTTIQCGLSRLSGKLSRDDNYYYIGKPCTVDGGTSSSNSEKLQNGEEPLVGGHYLQYELNSGRNKLGNVGTQLLQRLQRHYNQNHNVILSIETFMNGLSTNVGYETLKNVLLKDFHVRIVVSYRRYFEWIPSIYYQMNSYQIQQPGSLLDFIIDQVTTVIDDPNNKRQRRRIYKNQHPTLTTIQKYQPYFDDDLYIFNINDVDDEERGVLTNFICNVLPTATNVCNRMRMKDNTKARRIQQDMTTNTTTTTTTAPSSFNNNNNNDRKYRVSTSLDWQRLRSAVASAASSSYSVNGLEIIFAKERFELYQKTYPKEYKSLLTCLNSKQQRDLLNLSIKFERELGDYIVTYPNLKNNNEHIVKKLLFGGGNNNDTNDNETKTHSSSLSSSSSWRQKHYDDFYEYVRKGKYCELNTTLALQDTNSNFMRYVFGNK